MPHYPLPDVIGVDLYRQDAVVIRRGYHRDSVTATRSPVKEFSKDSRRRLSFIASNTDVVFTAMATLTYPREFPSDGAKVKRDWAVFREALLRKVPGLEYLWFLEFQKRGAPHIHLMIRGMRVWDETQHWLSETWYRICGSGDPLHLKAGTRLELIRLPDGARHYTVKHMAKMRQKLVPEGYRNVGRFWGCSKGVKPLARREIQCTNDDLVGALAAGGWAWQKEDTIRWSVLYGASVLLTLWTSDCILDLRSRGQTVPIQLHA